MGIGKNLALATSKFLETLVQDDEPLGKQRLAPTQAISSLVPPVSMLPLQPEIEDKKTERPSWEGGLGPIFTDYSGKIERQQIGKPNITPQTLFTLAHTDPVTWSIIDVYKTRITEMGYCVAPDLDKEKSELALWEKEASLAASKYAITPQPVYEATFLPPAIAGPLKAKLTAIKAGDPDARRKIRWLIDYAELQIKKDLIPKAHAAEVKLQGCNGDAVDPFQALLELTIDDMCTYDAPAIGTVFNMLGDPTQWYHMPGHEIKIYKNRDFSTPPPPYRAYGWEVNGRIISEFTTDDLLYFPRNPQQNGYGFSPLEAAAYIITASLNADAYNMDSFKSNIPPGLLDLGKITPEQRGRFRVWWNNEIEGKDGGRAKVLMTNFGKDAINYTNLKGATQTEMQYMEYLEWTLLIKCMCYGVSPQEIGFTKFFKYETSNNQVKMTNRGVEDAAKFIENVFTEGIIKNQMGLRGLKFQLKRSSTMINKEAVETAKIRLDTGLSDQNEIREEWGQRPLAEGGDVPSIITKSGAIPVAMIGVDIEGATGNESDPALGDRGNPDDEAASEKAVAAEKDPKKKEEAIKKMVDNYKERLEKKTGIEYTEPGSTTAGRIKGARARRNKELRTFKKDIGVSAAKLAKETGSTIAKLIGDE